MVYLKIHSILIFHKVIAFYISKYLQAINAQFLYLGYHL